MAEQRESEPDIFESIAAVIGEEAAGKFAQAFRGVRIYIPRHPDELNTITRAIGFEAARALGNRFGGEEVALPIYRSRAQRMRDRGRIVELHLVGRSAAQIAREVGCSERQVYKILSSLRA